MKLVSQRAFWIFVIGLVALVAYETNFCLTVGLSSELLKLYGRQSCKAKFYAFLKVINLLSATLIATCMIGFGVARLFTLTKLLASISESSSLTSEDREKLINDF